MSTSLERVEPVLALERAVNQAEVLNSIIETILGHENRVREGFLKVASAQNNAQMSEAANTLHATLDQVLGSLQKINASELLFSLRDFRKQVNDSLSGGLELRAADHLQRAAEVLTGAYDGYVKNQSRPSALKVLLVAKELNDITQGVREVVGDVRGRLTPSVEVPEGYRPLEIVLSSTLTVAEAVAKLQALLGLYAELCRLYGLSEHDYPLRVISIEIGSADIKVLGQIAASAGLKEMLFKFGAYLRRNYTREGRIEGLKNRAETIAAVKTLLEGVISDADVAEAVQADLDRAAQAVTRDLVVLYEGEDSLEVDGEIVSVIPPEIRHGRIGSGDRRRLLPGSPGEEE